jgi:hypothetical protein
MYFIGSVFESADAEADFEMGAEAEFAGLERALSATAPSLPEAIRRLRASAANRTRHSMALSQRYLWAIFIQNAGQSSVHYRLSWEEVNEAALSFWLRGAKRQ